MNTILTGLLKLVDKLPFKGYRTLIGAVAIVAANLFGVVADHLNGTLTAEKLTVYGNALGASVLAVYAALHIPKTPPQ